jgi:membrane protein implicated in regulation of membrane protease activity
MCSLASTRLRLLSAAVAATAAVVAYNLPFKLNIVVAIVIAVMLCLAAENLRKQMKEIKP